MNRKLKIEQAADRSKALNFGLLLVFIVIVCIRLPDVLLEGRFFGEEGTNFFAYAWHMPWQEALLHPLGGYLNIVASASTLLAKVLVTSGFLSLAHAPYVTMLVALFFQCCPAFLILASRDHWLAPWWAKPAALLVVATAPAVEEVWLHSLHSQFHLTLCVALIIACCVPKTGRGWWLALLGLAPLTGPAAIVLLPVLALRALIERSAARAVQVAVLSAGSALQLLVFYTPSPVRNFQIDVNSLASLLVVRHVALPFGTPVMANQASGAIKPELLAGGIVWWPIVFCAVFFGALALVALRRWKETPAFLIIPAFGLATASYFGALNPSVELLDVFKGERYTFVPQVLMNLGFLALATTRTGAEKRVFTFASLLVILVGLIVFNHKALIIERGPNWTSQAKAWEQDPRHLLETWPAGWHVDLSPGPARCGPAFKPPRLFCDEAWEQRQRDELAASRH